MKVHIFLGMGSHPLDAIHQAQVEVATWLHDNPHTQVFNQSTTMACNAQRAEWVFTLTLIVREP